MCHVTQGANGTVTFAANGNLTYTPNANFNGSDTFTYTVTSGGVTETATVSVTITAVNDPPVNTVPPAQTTNEDTNLVLTGVAVADVDGGPLTSTLSLPAGTGTLSVVTGGGATITNNGTATVTIAGTAAQINAALAAITYTPTADYNTGSPSPPFNLTVATTDGTATDTDTVAITVTPVADIVADAVTTSEDTALTFNALTGVGGGSADSFENAGRVVSSVTQGTNGTVTFAANGNLTYTPNANYHGRDTFTYTVTSGGVDRRRPPSTSPSPRSTIRRSTPCPWPRPRPKTRPWSSPGSRSPDVDNASLSTTLSLPAGSGTLSRHGRHSGADGHRRRQPAR
ncbi:MAG: tandem-95 repeat protein [Candidatus Accumulibacter sp.]|nr:tandem-95 repeat protein [Accumulibacter sp.]